MRALKIIMKTMGYTLLAVLAYMALSFGFAYGISTLIDAGLLPEFAASIPVSIVLIALVFIVPKRVWRWRGALEFKAERFIEAPARQVWRAIYPQAKTKHYQAVIEKITALIAPNETGLERFRYHFIPALHDEGSPEYYDVDISHAAPFSELRINPVNTETLPLFGKTAAGTRWELVPRENGTWVRMTEYQNRPSILSMAMLWFLKPHRDDLKQLADHCEGRENTSWMGQTTKRMVASNNSVSREAGLAQPLADQTLILTTVCVTAIAIVGFMLFFIFKMTA